VDPPATNCLLAFCSPILARRTHATALPGAYRPPPHAQTPPEGDRDFMPSETHSTGNPGANNYFRLLSATGGVAVM